jgi:ABC-type Na+ efflux pump permease subunit
MFTILLLFALVLLVLPCFWIKEEKILHTLIKVCFVCAFSLSVFVGISSLSYANGEGGGVLFAAAYLVIATFLYFTQWLINKNFFKNKKSKSKN